MGTRRRPHKPAVVAFLQNDHFIAFFKAELIFINRLVTKNRAVPKRDKYIIFYTSVPTNAKLADYVDREGDESFLSFYSIFIHQGG